HRFGLGRHFYGQNTSHLDLLRHHRAELVIEQIDGVNFFTPKTLGQMVGDVDRLPVFRRGRLIDCFADDRGLALPEEVAALAPYQLQLDPSGWMLLNEAL